MSNPGGFIAVLLLLFSTAAGAEHPARISIVIDDLGFQLEHDQAILELDRRLTVSIIPESPAAARLARQAGAQRRDVLVHLPLAGLFQDDCQQLLTCIGLDWSVDQMEQALLTALAQVDGAIGLNNHQGSRFTSDTEAVRRLVAGILRVSKQRPEPLIVLDSRTVPNTVFEYKARKAGLPSGRRHVFLDHSERPEDIVRAWENLLELARRNGSAIAIAHPRPNTIKFLTEALPHLEAAGIELVPISALASQPGDWPALSPASALSSAP